MPLVSYLLDQESEEFKWNLFSHQGQLCCSFFDTELKDELCFHDIPEGREIQLTKKVKKQIRDSAEDLIRNHSSLINAPRQRSGILPASLSSGTAETREHEKFQKQPAERPRQEPQERDSMEFQKQPAERPRQEPQERTDQEAKTLRSNGSTMNMSAAILPSPAPGLSAEVSNPSPCWLSVNSTQSSGLDVQLKRLKRCRQDVSQYKILELFSPPRVSVKAAQEGFSLTNPSNFDKDTGWNFFDAKDRALFWKVMREQKPDCVLMTPDCKAFSLMMCSNWERMDPEMTQRLQQEGLAMLHFCIQVAEHQLSCGKEFCMEHPAYASSSQTHAVKWLTEQLGVIRIIFDQCMTGLKVCEKGVSKKSTALITNHLGIATIFSALQCSRDHEHIPLESGLPRKAQVFGPELIQKFISALKLEPDASFYEDEIDDDDLERALDREVEAGGQPQPAPLPARRVAGDRLTASQINKINQVHVNLGHIAKDQMLALFKAAGAKDSVLRYVKDEFTCAQCMRQRRPIERKRATMTRTFQFNRHVGLDVFCISWGGTTHAFLNMICHGANMQQVTWLRGCEAGTPPSRLVWQTFMQTWVKPFGLPQVVVTDGGSEFKDVFERGMEQNNILQVVCDASSPWQNGKVERRGGWVKERAELELSSGQCVVTSSEELEELIDYVVCHKNRWFSRGGFSPCQLVFGVNPTIPADLLGDGPQDLAWQDIDADVFDQDSAAQAFARSHRIRQRARELCIQDSAQTKIRLSSKGRLHRQRQWAVGQWVYVWRKFPGTGGGHTTRSRWTGPGIVLLQSGHTVFVSMRARLWKCNSDQLRAANPYESVGAALADTKEMQDILTQSRQGRSGAVDVASEGAPPDDAEEQPVPPIDAGLEPSHRAPLGSIPEEPEENVRRVSDDNGPAPEPRIGVGHSLRDAISPPPEEVPDAPVEQEVQRTRTASREEPLAEPAPFDKRRRISSSIASSDGNPQSEIENQPGRVKRQVDTIETGLQERDVTTPLSRFEREVFRDLQRVERERKIARMNEAASSSAARPEDSSSSAAPAEVSIDGPLEEVTEEHDDLDLYSSVPLSQVSFLQMSAVDGNNLMVKPIKHNNSEFNMKEATTADVEGFKASDTAEWKSIVDFGAVKVLNDKEAALIRQEQPHRILASRVVRRKKPMPGIGNFKYKSRWCVLGHSDPDSGSYKTFSPMPSTEAISLFFQLALCLGLHMAFADVKSAFCQSDLLDRPQGPLFAEVCPGLGLSTKCLIQLVAPVYGLDDAPIRWHHTVLQFLLSIGFERSLFEPCWLIKRENGKIVGMMLLEGDDFNIATTREYQPVLHKLLNERFVFGKWEYDSADFAGRTVSFQGDRVLMTQEKYIVEKLHQIKLPKGALGDKQVRLSQDQFEEYRSMLYKVSWLAHQTRPEAAGIVSLLSSRLNQSTIHDLDCLNKLVHHIKSTASQPLVLHKFDVDKLVLIAASDAGGVASKPVLEEKPEDELIDTVQGAWVILASDRMPSASQKTKVSVLSWRSSKLKRRVSSTLAGEALSFSQALAEVEWLQLMIRDVLHGDVCKEDWRKSIVPFVAVLKEECELKERLRQCHVTDAKSLYDAITKESIGSRQDRRTAVEIAIILDALRRSGSTVRWTPHPRMIADVLTKDNIGKSNGAFEELLRTSKMSLWEETEELLRRKEDPKCKQRSKKASERLRQEASYLLLAGSLGNKNFGELIQLYHQCCHDSEHLPKLPC